MNDTTHAKPPTLLPGQFTFTDALIQSIESATRAFDELWDEMDKQRLPPPPPASDKR